MLSRLAAVTCLELASCVSRMQLTVADGQVAGRAKRTSRCSAPPSLPKLKPLEYASWPQRPGWRQMVPFHRGSRAGMPDLAMAQQPGMCLWPVLLCISLDPFPPAACAASKLLTHSAQALALLLRLTEFMSCK